MSFQLVARYLFGDYSVSFERSFIGSEKPSPKNTLLRHNPIMQRHSTSPPSATTKIRSKTIGLL